MKTSRIDLVALLNIVKPALSGKNQVNELTHYWFDGKFLSAYDDIIGIRVPCETDFQGGVPGGLILPLLEKSKARDVTLTKSKDDNLDIKAGSAFAHLALLPAEQQIWNPNEFNWSAGFSLDELIINAISLSLISTGVQKTMRSEQRGLSFVPSDGGILDIYSTDEKSISWARTTKPTDFPETRVIIPTAFCEQVVKNAAAGDLMLLDDNSACFKSKSGTVIFTRLVEVSDPIDFNKVLVEDHGVGNGKNMVELPLRFESALDRVSIVLDKANGSPAEFAIENGCLYISGKSSLGEIEDVLKFKEPGSHKEITVNLDPSLISRALADRDKMFIEEQCMVLQGPDWFYHIIACV